MEIPAVPGGATARHISLGHFRNYDELDIELEPGILLVVGANAQGKTNLLEALYLASSTRVLRGQRDSEAIQEGYDKAFVSVEIDPGSTQVSVILERGARKRLLLNGLALPRASDVLGRLPSVCISSADLPLVSGEPSDRRLFLDLALSQLYPSYLRHLAVYKRALEQRNALLKDAQNFPAGDSQFEVWEQELARHGAAIRSHRRVYISNLTPYAQECQAALGAGEGLVLDYGSKDGGDNEESLAELLASQRAFEIARGTTSVGPHRDDLFIEIGGRDARLYGSQGQQRTGMLSIKLGAMELERAERGAPPLLLLDDILSDLDEGRRSRLLDWVPARAGQTVLTCTETAAAGPAILSSARVIEIREGKVVD